MRFSARSALLEHRAEKSIASGSNFAVYTTSEGLSFIHMGVLSVAGIVLALLADLCVTPILIQKFRLFGKETDTNETRVE